ncbi:OmpA family protein [Shewanella glacialimarina]|jgi:OOP family OmpA-OmpF porin|uniref:OmpA family protein n=1 Tax=Shewanella glacialimarina TaxID=2590884 RepID=UPI001CF9117D|nr:OmpA family protein [Shewanella glacialimarina]UCX03917.1 OmpA family protein [Shewanella glacialimarina]
MMKNILKVVLLTSMLPFAASAAEELTPWYVGGGLGVNNYEPNCDQKTMKVCGEDDPYAWDVFGGYLFNDYFGVELGYRDLGRAEWTDYSNKLNDVGARGMSLGLVAFYPFANKWSLSAEAGAMNYLISNKKQWDTEYYSDNGIAPYIGAGIGYNFTDNLKLAAKYRRYENLDEEKWNTLSMESNYWGLELSYRFGSVKAAPVAAVVAPVVVVAADADSDSDGVVDRLDKCPNTPSNHKVDATGCTVYELATTKHDLGGILFANDSAVINQASFSDLEKLANYMKKNPEHTVIVEGHASNVGKPAYNMALSDRRASSVANALTSKYGISANRIKSMGYGVTKPVVEGNTAEAHRRNRRIEAIVTGTEKRAVLK